jgi:ribosomal protein L30E
VSGNLPAVRKSEIEYYAMLSKTGVHHYSGSEFFAHGAWGLRMALAAQAQRACAGKIAASGCGRRRRQGRALSHRCRAPDPAIPPPNTPRPPDNVDLGTACGKYFRVSVLAITDPGDSDIIKSTE